MIVLFNALYTFYDTWDGTITFQNLCLWLLCNKCHATIASVSIYLYLTFVFLATHTMENWASILRQMPDRPPLTHLSLCTSLSLCPSSVLTNFCFHHSHKVILFISSLILYITSYLLLPKSSSLPHHIPTMSAVKFSICCFTLPFNLMDFAVSFVSNTYPKTQVFTSFVFN